MNAWKLKYKKVGHFATMTNWMDEPTARNWFSQLKADSSCDWAELIYNDEEDDILMDEFVR